MYAYAANNPVHYIDPDGRTNDPYEMYIYGSEALEMMMELPELPPAIVSGGISFLASLSTWALLFLGCQLFVCDSATPKLPPNYSYYNGNIYAPNGAIIGTVDQAWKHWEGRPDWADIEGWGKGTFSTANDSILYHFEKHGKEVDARTVDQYLNKAKGFMENLKRAEGPYPSYNDFGEQTGWKWIKKDKYIILDLNKEKILSFGSKYHKDEN